VPWKAQKNRKLSRGAHMDRHE